MAKVIIGIHGLGNKPPGHVLQKWWKRSIRDGLKRIGRNRLFLPFDMVYWADIMHEKPFDPNITDKEDTLCDNEPYVPPRTLPYQDPEKLRKKVLDFIEQQLDKVLLNDDMTVNYSFITDKIIHHYFKELDCYFPESNNDQVSCPEVRDAVDMRIREVLNKHKGKDILLISHSMGTIIAYDVLTRLEHEVEVDTFVTMGSPLGLPVIVGKLAAEKAKSTGAKFEARTPENVLRNWINFSDLEDKIAFNYNVGDDYKENSRHIRAHDMVVQNDYAINGNENPHKSYGYLRTPELAKVIDDFMDRGRSRAMKKILKWIDTLFAR